MEDKEKDLNAAEDGMLNVPEELRAEIEKKIEALKAKDASLKKITAIVIEGDTDCDEKEFYVGYFKRPNAATFTKYLAALSANNTVPGARMVAKETFVDGDREMIDDDDLFLFGTFMQIQNLMRTRQGNFVNLSKPRK